MECKTQLNFRTKEDIKMVFNQQDYTFVEEGDTILISKMRNDVVLSKNAYIISDAFSVTRIYNNPIFNHRSDIVIETNHPQNIFNAFYKLPVDVSASVPENKSHILW